VAGPPQARRANTIRSVHRGLGERPVFSVEERVFRWDDVLDWAGRSGALAALEHETALGLAALERDGLPPADDVQAAAAAFRYARGLLSGDEMEAWLERRELTTEEWLDHLRRTLARERESGSEPQSPAVAADEDAVWADAVCSGALDRWAFELAARLAVSRGAEPDDEAYARFRERAVTDDAVTREIEGRRLEWLRVEGDRLELADEDVAREVVLSAREDGDSLAELAGRARAELRPLASYLDDLEPELAAAVLGAREGEILGPVTVAGRFVVAVPRRKAEPSPDDPALRGRAAELVFRRAVDRELEQRVRWHDAD
jgi:hypothetical protein